MTSKKRDCNGFACLLTPMLLEACGIATPTSCSQPCLHAHLFCVLSHGFSRKRESAVNLLIKGFDSPSLVLSKLCVLKTFKVAYNLQLDENIIYGKFCFSFHGGPLPGIQSGGVKLEKGQDKKGWGEARQSISQSIIHKVVWNQMLHSYRLCRSRKLTITNVNKLSQSIISNVYFLIYTLQFHWPTDSLLINILFTEWPDLYVHWNAEGFTK